MSGRRHLGPHDEAGSTIIVAVMVMVVLTTLILVGLARTMSVMTMVRHGQDYDAALAVADAGLADALYRIDSGEPATFPGSGTSGAGTYEYKAERVDGTEFRVASVGRLGDVSHAVQARVTRTVRFPWALFANEELVVQPGGLGVNVHSFNSIGGPNATEARVGSNNKIACQGIALGTSQHSPDSLTDCPNPQPMASPYVLEPVVGPAAGVATLSCPLLGIFTGVINGQNGRPFVCQRDVILAGLVTVLNPPFVLYVLPDAGGEHHSLNMTTALANPSGRAANVQIYKAGAAALTVGTASTIADVSFSGVLYAPESTLELSGSKWWNGSITVNRLKVTGAPILKIGFDADLDTLLGVDWTLSRYREVPASTVDVSP